MVRAYLYVKAGTHAGLGRRQQMSVYGRFITEATGVTDASQLAVIEESMRQDIFHSTLDWQSADELRKGAKAAVFLLESDGILCL
jgi:hypothetical protein